MRNPKRNKSGCLDPVPFEALSNISRAESQLKVSEAQEQKMLMDWAEWNEKRYPDLWYLHHIPNGGSRNVVEAKNLKSQGVKPGVSDLFLPVARRGYHGMYIEMKAIGGRLSEKQAEWINRVREQGYAAFVCYGAAEAIGKLKWYLGG